MKSDVVATSSPAKASSGWDLRQQRTRHDVIVAARELISTDGLDGLTMRKLGARAGVSVATLYNQFGDRNGVLVAIVASGLDQLEAALDDRPAGGPLAVTRAMFEMLDSMISSAVDVWQPVFTILTAGRTTRGIGTVGDRAVHVIRTDLDHAASLGLLVDGCETAILAQHILASRMNRLEKWATGIIEWDAYQTSSRLGLELLLAAVLVDEGARRRALADSGVITHAEV